MIVFTSRYIFCPDIKATAELENKIETRPDSVRKEELSQYKDMLQKQMAAPDKSSIKILGMELNQVLALANVAAIPTATGVEQLLRMGKFAFDVTRMSEKTVTPEMKMKMAKAKDIEESLGIDEESVNNEKLASAQFANQFRNIMREHVVGAAEYGQMNEEDDLYIALTEKIDDVLRAESSNAGDKKENMRNALRLLGATTAGLGGLFDKQVDQMTDEEVAMHTRAVRNVMMPLKENSDYMRNFADLYAIGEEDMSDWHKELTDNMQAAMIVGQQDAAVNFRRAGRLMMDAAQKQNEYEKDKSETNYCYSRK